MCRTVCLCPCCHVCCCVARACRVHGEPEREPAPAQHVCGGQLLSDSGPSLAWHVVDAVDRPGIPSDAVLALLGSSSAPPPAARPGRTPRARAQLLARFGARDSAPGVPPFAHLLPAMAPVPPAWVNTYGLTVTFSLHPQSLTTVQLMLAKHNVALGDIMSPEWPLAKARRPRPGACRAGAGAPRARVRDVPVSACWVRR